MFAEAKIEKQVKGVEEEIRVLLPRLKGQAPARNFGCFLPSWQEEPAIDLEKEIRERREREMAVGI